MKICGSCNINKPLTDFGKAGKDSSKLRRNCKECWRESVKKWKLEHKDAAIKFREVGKISAKRYLKKGGEWFNQYKRTLKCEYCLESTHYVLDFHHRIPKDKKFSIGQGVANFSIETIKNEIAKCMVLCSNCHRKLHWLERHPEERVNLYNNNIDQRYIEFLKVLLHR